MKELNLQANNMIDLFPKQVFKAYDIRGLIEGELSVDLAYRIGRAYGVLLHGLFKDLDNKSVVVGQDMRKSSPQYASEVIRGLNDEGLNVTDVGLVSTPLFNFACTNYPEHAAGIMVTASHNPAEYNGFKMTLRDGTPIGRDNGMSTIRDLAEKNEWKQSMTGSVANKEVLQDYLNKILTLVKPEEIKPLKIETLTTLQEKVKEVGADFGFALDGDADRLGLADENGKVVEASFVGALIGLEVF